jgi:hypothetical protein
MALRINELTAHLSQLASLPRPDPDPLFEVEALDEASLVDLRIDMACSTALVVFDLRQALQLRSAQAAVLIGRGVRLWEWVTEGRLQIPAAWRVLGWKSSPSLHTIEFGCAPDATCKVEASQFCIVMGDIPGLASAPSDYLSRSMDWEWDIPRITSEIQPTAYSCTPR